MIKLNLRFSLIVLFLVIALFPLLTTGIINIQRDRELIRNQIISGDRTNLKNLTDEIQRFLDTTISDIRMLRGTTSMKALVQVIATKDSLVLQQDRQQLEQEFVNFLQERKLNDLPIYEHIRFLNTNGFEFVRVDNVEGTAQVASGIGLNTRARQKDFEATTKLNPDSIYVSPVEIFDEFGKVQTPYVPVLRYSMPLFYNGTLQGVLVTDVRAEGFLKIITDSKSTDSTTFLVDQNGIYLAHPDSKKLFGAELGSQEKLQNDYPNLTYVLNDTSSNLTQLDDSIAIYQSVAPPGNPSFHWVLIKMVPLEFVLSVVQQQIQTLYLSFIVVGVLISIIAVIVAQNISRPIVAVTKAATAFAGGKFDQTLKITRSDEIGILQRSINSMASQLKGLIGDLEARVRSRTRELEQARKEAEDASNAKSLFISNMSHELRTPLNIVIGYTSAMLDMPQMYKNEPLAAIYRTDIEQIRANGQHLLGLINDILDLSKIESGKLELNLNAIDLVEIFKGVIATSLGLVKDKSLQIRPDFPPQLPLVWADPLRIRQMLLNLMSNAIKFTETGSVSLTAQVEEDGVRISIIDTGIGIPPEELASIFDRYQQIRNKSSIQGTGLGLDICQHLAHMHGSTITVQSVLGQGSIFSFVLACAQPEQITMPKPTLVDSIDVNKSISQSAWQANSSARTILVVEDDNETRTMIRRTLEDAGHVIFDTHHSSQVMDLATGLLPDLIILDSQLVDSPGLAVFDQLKANAETSDLAVVILSDVANISNLDTRFTNIRLLIKPVTSDDILSCIQTILHSPTRSTKR